MAGIWIHQQNEKEISAEPQSPWNLAGLETGKIYVLDLRGGAPATLEGPSKAIEAAKRILLIPVMREKEERWVLLAPPGAVYVNGLPLLTGIRTLRDLDEIACGGVHRAYIAYADPARVVPFPGEEHPVHCARCRRVLQVGDPVVRCPNPRCRAWHHQDPANELECWTYAPRCGACEQATALDGESGWTPMGL